MYYTIEGYPGMYWSSISKLIETVLQKGICPSANILDHTGKSYGPISDYIVF